MLVLPPRAGHVHGGAFFRGDDEGVGEGEDCGGGVSGGCKERRGEGGLPTKPVKAGRKDLGVAGIACGSVSVLGGLMCRV